MENKLFESWTLGSRRNHDLSIFLANQKRLSRTLADLSKQRVLKNLRRLDYAFYQYNEVKINRLVSRSWRLEKLLLDCSDSYFSMKKFVRMSRNPHLKDFFFFGKNLSQNDLERLIDRWEYLVDCRLWLQCSLALKTKKIRSFAKFLKGSNKNQVIESIDGISSGAPLIFDLSSMNANQLPNLKTLRVSYSVLVQKDQCCPALDFIKNYSQLTSLVITTRGKDVPSIEFLGSLSNLKQLTFDSCEEHDLKIPKTLPLIDSLEKPVILASFHQKSPRVFHQ